MAGPYNIIYADPPWSYNDKMRGHSFSLDHEYPTMPLSEIKSLPVQSLAAKDCLLFLWVTSPFLREGLEVMDAWGFKYVTVPFYWSKLTSTGKKAWNLGRWTMGNMELMMLGRRGHPKRIRADIKQQIEAVRGRHSEKPAEARDRIVQLMGDLPRIELFARQTAPGWDVWGNEVACSIEMGGTGRSEIP